MGEQQLGDVDPLQNCASRKGVTDTEHILLPQVQSLQVSAQALYIGTHSTSRGGTYGPSDEDCLMMHVVMMSLVTSYCTSGK